MGSRGILTVFLVLFVLERAWNVLLVTLNRGRARANAGAVPKAFEATVDKTLYSKAVSYTLVRSSFGLVATGVSTALLLVAVLSGVLGALDSATGRLPLHPYLRSVLYIAALAAASWLANLPFSLYSTFSIEARFGFNKITPGLFIIDTLKSLALSAVIGLPLLLGLFWFMDATGRFWWIWAFCGLTLLQLTMTFLYPVVIAPLFNKFTPLPDGSLKESILSLANRMDFRTRGIFLMDGSRRSRHSNAYFTGLGRYKRIVLYDTLVNESPEEEIVSVLAHEIGHEKRNHLKKMPAVSILLSLAGFWILSALLPYEPLYRAFGFSVPSKHAILVILAFCSGPFTFVFTPLSSAWSRKHEYEADSFAAEAVGNASGLKSALLRLARNNLSNLTPHPLYSFYHYSHPTLSERLAALDRHGEKAACSPSPS